MFCECGCGQITNIIKKTQKSRGRVIGEYSRFIMGHNDKKCWNKDKTGVYSEKTLKKMSGKNSHYYKDGRTLAETYCKDCGKPIYFTATHCNICRNRSGGKNPNWHGGLSFEPYSSDFNQQLKDRIRVRDNFICQKCGVPELECERRLAIHHIDYNKENCKEDNLLSLCNKCNTTVNFNREYWTNYFQLKTGANCG